MKQLSICVVGFLICSALFSEFFVNNELPSFANNEQMNAIIVFRDETLDDLARLLKPMKMSGMFSSSAASKEIYLQDATYIGAVNGRAELVTVWVSKDINDPTTLLPSDKSKTTIQSVADSLSKDKLANTTFAIIPVEIEWKDWALSIYRSGTAVVRGKDSLEFQRIISTSPALISKVDTRSVNVPIGYNQEKMVSMQPWFENERIVIELKPAGNNVVSVSVPSTVELKGNAGVVAGTAFLNNTYFSDFRQRIFNIGKDESSSHLKNISIASDLGRVAVSGNFDVPLPSSVKFQAVFDGDDLRFSGIMPMEINCGDLNSMQCLQLKLKYRAGSLAVTSKYKNTLLRNDNLQLLGNFYVGSRPINGTAKIDKISGSDGKLVFLGKVRLNGGHDL